MARNAMPLNVATGHERTTETKPMAPAKKRQTKKRTALTPSEVSSVPLIDETTFPFLKLPGEIRNMVYHYSLVDSAYSIRFEANVSKRDGRGIVRRLYRARPGPPDRDDLPGQTKGSITKASHSYKRLEDLCRSPMQSAFGIGIFQVCREINNEAASIFYGHNLFVFGAVPHLYAFLAHFHHRLPLVRNLGLTGLSENPDTFRGPKLLARTSLEHIWPLLASATHLEALYLHTWIWQALSSKAQLAANVFFNQAHCWMHALALQKEDKLAVLDAIRLPMVSTKVWSTPRWSTDAAAQREFRSVLARRLTEV